MLNQKLAKVKVARTILNPMYLKVNNIKLMLLL